MSGRKRSRSGRQAADAVGVEELHRLLREQLTKTLTDAGWMVDVAYDTEPGAPSVAAFRRVVADEFFATAYFFRTVPRAKPPMEVSGTIGVSFGPAYRLWPLVIDDERSEFDADLGQLTGSHHDLTVVVSRPGDVAKAAQRLAAPVVADGTEWAARYASFDALLEASRADPERFDSAIEVVPVLLAAAGRPDEARAELARYQAIDREEVATREYRRFASQLLRWLDGGAVLPQPPSEPVREPIPFEWQPPAFGDVWQEARARRKAMNTMRNARRGKGRDELREELNAEMARRGVNLTPLEMEQKLDVMTATPRDRARLGFRGLKGLIDVGRSIRTLLKEGAAPTPEWLEPPARASYPVKTNSRDWVEVAVDAASGTWLDRVLSTAPMRVNDTVRVDAWLKWEPEPPTPDSRIAVCIGSEQVATLDAAAAELYRPCMDDAEQRDELPIVGARLTELHDPDRYLLELAAPRQQ